MGSPDCISVFGIVKFTLERDPWWLRVFYCNPGFHYARMNMLMHHGPICDRHKRSSPHTKSMRGFVYWRLVDANTSNHQ